MKNKKFLLFSFILIILILVLFLISEETSAKSKNKLAHKTHKTTKTLYTNLYVDNPIPTTTIKQEVKNVIELTEEDRKHLLQIAMAEAGNQGVEGQAIVMNVILNRVKSNYFPDTIYEVITQRYKGVYQFSPVGDGRFYTVVPNDDSYKALELILSGHDESSESLYFIADYVNEGSWHQNNLLLVKILGNHVFYK